MYKLNETQKAYMAGILDGEGSIYLRSVFNKSGRLPTYSLTVTVVVGTEYDALLAMGRMIGRRPSERLNGTGNKKPAWRIRIHTNDALEYLRQLYPYLIIKKKQADLAINFQSTKTPRGQRPTADRIKYEKWAKKKLTKLNHRGIK